MVKLKYLRWVCFWVSGLMLVTIADAARLFRYKDDKGHTVLDSRIPKEFVSRGYDIIDEHGRLIQRVPRSLTAEEIVEKNRQKALELAKAEAEAEALKRDKKLLRLYTVPEDVERARDRKVNALEGLVQTAKNGVQRLLTEKEVQQSRAAKLERQGREVPADIEKSIASIDRQIGVLEKQIDSRRVEQDGIKNSYGKDLRRMKELLGIVDEVEPGEQVETAAEVDSEAD